MKQTTIFLLLLLLVIAPVFSATNWYDDVNYDRTYSTSAQYYDCQGPCLTQQDIDRRIAYYNYYSDVLGNYPQTRLTYDPRPVRYQSNYNSYPINNYQNYDSYQLPYQSYNTYHYNNEYYRSGPQYRTLATYKTGNYPSTQIGYYYDFRPFD